MTRAMPDGIPAPPRSWRDHPLVARWRSHPGEWRGIVASALLAALVFLPWLGAVGLWDPW